MKGARRSLVAAGTVLAASSGARAAGPLPSLAWESPAECPDAAEVAHRVEVLLAGRADTVVDAQVRVTRSATGYRTVVRVRTERGQGERVLDTASCAAAAEASALVIAMSAAPGAPFSAAGAEASASRPAAAAPAAVAQTPAVTPPAAAAVATQPAIASTPSSGGAALATPAESAKPGDPVTPSTPTAPDRPAAPAPPGVEDGAGRPRRFRAGAGATADTASLPQPAIGPTVTLSARPLDVLSIDLSGTYWPTQTAMATSTIGGHFDLVDASLRGCYERRLGLDLGACAGFFVDWLEGRGFGTALPPAQAHQTSVYGGPLAAGSARFAFTDWLGARLLAEADVPLRRQAFVVLGLDGNVHRTAAATARLALSLEATF